jgi:hypothetical protein
MFNIKTLSNRFFKNRAKVASELLSELNPDVIGDYLSEVDIILNRFGRILFISIN